MKTHEATLNPQSAPFFNTRGTEIRPGKIILSVQDIKNIIGENAEYLKKFEIEGMADIIELPGVIKFADVVRNGSWISEATLLGKKHIFDKEPPANQMSLWNRLYKYMSRQELMLQVARFNTGYRHYGRNK
ncbi:MAG: hypothetical protein LBR41_03095 [Rickettsiales bacterium]|jgi:hypothetical protein|nr:hypothetical protein [Rickettsiales bacterium]